MWLESHTIKVEKPGEISRQRLLLVLVKSLEIRRDHEDKGVAADASEVRHRQEGLIEDLLDDHHNRAEVLPLENELLDVVNSVYATVALGCREVLILMALLINTDVNFEVPHLLINGLRPKPEQLQIYFFLLLDIPLRLELELCVLLLFSLAFDLRDCSLDLSLIDGL